MVTFGVWQMRITSQKCIFDFLGNARFLQRLTWRKQW